MLKVLIVDDKPSVCAGLARLIRWEEAGAELVGTCGNGKEALEVALRTEPDVLITDIRMPLMDGLELCAHVRERLPDTMLVILSAYHEFSYAQTAIRYGVTDYILKPIDKTKIARLTAKLREWAADRESRSRFFGLFYDKEWRAKLVAGVKTGDLEFVADCFDTVFKARDAMGRDTVKEIGSRLLDAVPDIVRDIGLTPDYFGIDWERERREFGQARSKEEMMAAVQSLYTGMARTVMERKSGRGEAVAEKLRHIVKTQFANPDLTVYTIASELHLSPNYIGLVFRQWTGENLSVYITRLRMERAKELLRDPGATVHEVAGRVGYADPHYFTKVFKKQEGLTPSQYRNMALRQGRDGE
ncbi:response regulator transcription factor [Paenibacillus flagellatus]|uniref:DNA-binding response regulator n=1 Tax=Paenibacillus flagellatus TaxID=2211139 RepID=A0A2V5K6C2_9BACL|nr:response regulator [Paenibacillus flagellatus]PYI53494.1 hypothetical protein DLM86_17140 [Paenibacillus flagellatus]